MMANPHKWMLFGWDLDTWRRALELPRHAHHKPAQPANGVLATRGG